MKLQDCDCLGDVRLAQAACSFAKLHPPTLPGQTPARHKGLLVQLTAQQNVISWNMNNYALLVLYSPLRRQDIAVVAEVMTASH